MVEKEGGFRHQHTAIVARPMLDDNPKRVHVKAFVSRCGSNAVFAKLTA
jgi:hypothetical protein